MIYAPIVNLALALINRLTPQIQIIFVAAPFVARCADLCDDQPPIEAFLIGFATWLASG